MNRGRGARIRLPPLKVGEASLAQYSADKRHYVSISTGNCSKQKTEVEELGNDLAGKSLSEGVLLYMSRNHPPDSFKGPLIFTSFVVVIHQRPYIRWFAVACRLRHKGVLSVYGPYRITR